MKLWKRIAALCLSVSTMGVSLLSTGCDMSDVVGLVDDVQSSSLENSVDSASESASETIHTHDWKEQIVLRPTCTERGVKVLKCACGEEKYEEMTPGHDLIIETKEASCMSSGYTYMQCKNCDYETYQQYSALGHDLICEREATATCMQMGLIRISCTQCEYVAYEREKIQQHLFINGGECFWCGKTQEEVDPDPFLKNNWWAQLAENSVGGGLDTDYSGDITMNGDPNAVVAYDGSPVTVKFYHTMGQKLRDVLDAALPAFYAQYPNITVVHESQGDYPSLRDQITTEIQAQDSPSIAYCYPDHVALYNKAKVVATLDDYMASETMGFTQAEVNEFVRGYYEEGRAYGDGKMYTLPFLKSSEVLYYNKTFFEENNLTVPTTWDEMEEVIQKIIKIDPNCIPLGYDSEANWFITMSKQLGTPYISTVEGEKFLFDVEANQAVVGRLREWYQRGWVTTEEIYGSYTSELFTQTDSNKTKSYMCIASSAGASYQCPDSYVNEEGQVVYPFEVGVAMIPQIDKNNPKVISQGPSLCMFKKRDQEMAATWLFMKFLTTNLNIQGAFSSTSGFAPVVKNLDQKLPAYASFLKSANGNSNLQAACVKQCLAQEDAMFVSPAFVGSSGARDRVGLLLQRCFVMAPQNGQTVADFIKNEFSKTINDLRSLYGA